LNPLEFIMAKKDRMMHFGPKLSEGETDGNSFDVQPDSGGVIGGVRGEQEYGIRDAVEEDSLEELNVGSQEDSEFVSEDDPAGSLPMEGGSASEYTLDQGRGLDELEESEDESETLQMDDTKIMQSTMNALTRNPDVHIKNLRLEVERGTVTLTGEARAESDRIRARELAEAIPGVREVRSRLGVRS
jgi:hypothetical protein